MATFRVRHSRLHRKSPLPLHSAAAAAADLFTQGRPFAWQEAQLALVTILQRFDLVMDDPTYELALKQTLTIKPHNFYIHALPRKDRGRVFALPSAGLRSERTAQGGAQIAPTATVSADAAKLQPLYVLYGSNTGNSESFAQRLASDAPAYGAYPCDIRRAVAH